MLEGVREVVLDLSRGRKFSVTLQGEARGPLGTRCGGRCQWSCLPLPVVSVDAALVSAGRKKLISPGLSRWQLLVQDLHVLPWGHCLGPPGDSLSLVEGGGWLWCRLQVPSLPQHKQDCTDLGNCLRIGTRALWAKKVLRPSESTQESKPILSWGPSQEGTPVMTVLP